MFKTKLTLVYCQRKSKLKTSYYRTSSMKIISKQFFLCHKLVENYNMHINKNNMHRCFHLLENRERLLENILNLLDVNEYVDFEKNSITL